MKKQPILPSCFQEFDFIDYTYDGYGEIQLVIDSAEAKKLTEYVLRFGWESVAGTARVCSAPVRAAKMDVILVFRKQELV